MEQKGHNDKICLDLRALLFHGTEGRVDPDKKKKKKKKKNNDKICLDLRALLFHGTEGRVDPDKISQ